MHRITIKNFGPLNEISLNINQTTIIIGEQANGKSTIIKLIYYFRRFQRFFLTIYAADQFPTWKEFRKAYLSQMKTIFTNTFGKTITLGNFELEYTFEDRYNITITPTDDNDYLNIQFSPALNTKLKNLWSSVFRPEDLADVFNDTCSCVYIPAGRALLSRQALLDLIQANELGMGFKPMAYGAFDLIDAITRDYMIEVSAMRTIFARTELSSFAHMIDAPERKNYFQYMCSLQEDILKGRYDTDGKNDYIILKQDKKVPVSYASSGQQEVMWITNLLLGYVANNGAKNCVLVEEPETHLHPDAQYALIKFIAAYQNLTGSQIFITTHSPYILSSINNLFYASKISKSKNHAAIHSVIPRQSWMNEETFQAYSVENGGLMDIRDADLAMADISRLDSISSRQDDEYEAMLSLPKEE